MRLYDAAKEENLNAYSLVALYFFLFLLGRIIFSVNGSYGLGYYFSLCMLFCFMVSAMLVPKKWLYVHSLMLLFSHPDITQDSNDVEINGVLPSASIWQFSVFGEPTILWVLSLFLIYFYRLRRLAIDLHLLYVFLLFLLVPLINSAINGFIVDIGRVIADLKFGIMLLLGLLFFNAPFFRDDKILLFNLMLILAGSFSILFYDLGALFINVLQRDEYEFKNLSLDVAKILTLFVFYWCMLKFKLDLKSLLYACLIIISLLLIFEYQTRWLVLTFVAGMFFLPGKYGFRTGFFVMSCAALIVVLYLAENQATVLMINRFNLFGAPDLATVDPSRYFSILNAISALNENSGWLFGLGAGSYFIDSPYPLSDLTTSAYDQASLDQGRYYRLHDFFSHFIFKFGIIGTGCYLYFIASYLKLRSTKIARSQDLNIFMFCLFCMLPTLVTFPNYTSKGVLLTAFFFTVFRNMRSSNLAR
ncbi:MAG: hypothetical protein HQ491_11650 [Bacteroidetes bacterium]|nr:hypothetical protein [Bacteroidota bacterium]